MLSWRGPCDAALMAQHIRANGERTTPGTLAALKNHWLVVACHYKFQASEKAAFPVPRCGASYPRKALDDVGNSLTARLPDLNGYPKHSTTAACTRVSGGRIEVSWRAGTRSRADLLSGAEGSGSPESKTPTQRELSGGAFLQSCRDLLSPRKVSRRMARTVSPCADDSRQGFGVQKPHGRFAGPLWASTVSAQP